MSDLAATDGLSAAGFNDYIENLNARMMAAIIMPPFRLGPAPLRCPACDRTRLACLQFYGRDRVHEEEIRARLAKEPEGT